MEQIAALLAHGGQIGASNAEGVSALGGAKASRDLLLQFRHPNVALGLVVIERNPRIVEEAQHIVGVSAQASEKIGCGRLLDPPASAGFARRFGVEPFACGEDRLVSSAIVPKAFLTQRRWHLSSVIGLGLGRAQQVDHLLRPGLSSGLGEKHQFAQVMGVAQRVSAVVVLVRHPAVMHSYTLEPGQNAEGVHGRLAAFVMRSVPTERRGHRRMQPTQPTAHPLPGFIKVRHRCALHRLSNACDRRCEQLCGLLEGQGHRVLAIPALSGALDAIKTGRSSLLIIAHSSEAALPVFLRRLRESPDLRRLPVLCVDPKSTPSEGVMLLDAGADDVIHRPFQPPIFLARVRTLLRRVVWAGEAPEEIVTVLVGGPIELRLVSRQGLIAGKPTELTRLEFDLLAHLMRHQDRAFKREELLAAVWNYPDGVETRTLDKHVESLRRKLGHAAPLLQTVHGVGYRFAAASVRP